jgi:hypothetical protein
MSLVGVYHRSLLHVLKWFAVAHGSVGTLIAILILVDWVGGAGWGYPWYALPFALLMIGLAIVLGKVAIAALRASGAKSAIG